MQVSYVITTFNRPQCLERATGFVAAERCADSELIVVDDQSATPVKLPDAARAAFPGAHQLIRNPANLGVIGARNTGLAAASGDLVLFLDDDDESLPNRTSCLLSAALGSGFDFVAARSFMQTDAGDVEVPSSPRTLLTPELCLLHPPHIDAVIWDRARLVARGGLDGRVPYLGEHLSLTSILLDGGQGLLLTDVVARFGYAELGLTDTARRQQHLTRYLIELYQVLLERPVPQRFRALAEGILRALQERAVHTFDEYLERLRQVVAGLAPATD
ncbi:MAG TPA: glycosyltransferase [Myxococcaceae bacterium]|jgi:hypothetical protein